ncbi:MAG: hypothetical protein ACR2NP_13275 [Pirellulaceae bacterium]
MTASTRQLTAVFGLTLFTLMASGCTHTRLKFNTIHQANTVNDIYQRQVLDNLAMFVDNPHAIPHFAVVDTGTTNATDSLAVAGTPFNSFRRIFGINATNAQTQSWALAPTTDPNRLQLMRCAYRSAIGFDCDPCLDCCKLEKAFRGKNDQRVPLFDSNGNQNIDPLTCAPFVTLERVPFIDPRTDQPYAIDEKCDCVVLQNLVCDGPCAIQAGWFCCGCKKDVPKDCLAYAGNFGKTWVWVLPSGREQLSRLVLANIEYAVSPPKASATKEVILAVDAAGKVTSDRGATVGYVRGVLPVGVSNQSILAVNPDPCGGVKTSAELAMQLRLEKFGELQRYLDEQESMNDNVRARLRGLAKSFADGGINESLLQDSYLQGMDDLQQFKRDVAVEARALQQEMSVQDPQFITPPPPVSTGYPTLPSIGGDVLRSRQLLNNLGPGLDRLLIDR